MVFGVPRVDADCLGQVKDGALLIAGGIQGGAEIVVGQMVLVCYGQGMAEQADTVTPVTDLRHVTAVRLATISIATVKSTVFE
jgi:hypothetical protein